MYPTDGRTPMAPTRAAPKDLETFFRRLEILRYLAESPQPRSEPEIRKHLEQAGAFHIADPDKVMSDEAKKKSVGRDLKDLWESSSHNSEACEQRDLLPIQNTFILRSGTPKQGYQYSLQPDASTSGKGKGPRAIPGRPGIPESLALLMANRFLMEFIPTEHYEALSATLNHARDVIQSRSKQGQENWQRVLERIAIFQRGQRLIDPQYNEDFLNLLYHAIAEGKCVQGEYESTPGEARTVLLHPWGVVFRLPKIYALGKPDNRQDGPLRQYLLHRFRSLTLSEQKSAVPEDFRVMPWLHSGGMDIVVFDDDGDEPVEVRLRVLSSEPGVADNLIRDLQDSRLSSSQIGPDLNAAGDWELVLPDTRITWQLIEWILGRGNRVEVLAPEKLRNRIREHLEAALAGYR
jgi:predicted DNA-binding transcriptional regulator YafY